MALSPDLRNHSGRFLQYDAKGILMLDEVGHPLAAPTESRFARSLTPTQKKSYLQADLRPFRVSITKTGTIHDYVSYHLNGRHLATEKSGRVFMTTEVIPHFRKPPPLRCPESKIKSGRVAK